MEVLWVWFGLLGGVAVLAAGCAFCVWLERKIPVKRYDERQREARGKGYRFGFWVGMAYYCILWIISECVDIDSKGVGVWILAGVFLQLLAAEIYTMITGAMLPFAQKPRVHVFVINFILGVMWLLNAFSTIEQQQVLFGQYSIPWPELILSVTFFSWGVIYLIDWLKRKRSDDE